MIARRHIRPLNKFAKPALNGSVRSTNQMDLLFELTC